MDKSLSDDSVNYPFLVDEDREYILNAKKKYNKKVNQSMLNFFDDV